MLGSGNRKFGNDQIWKQIIKEADEDGDGHITFPEFQKMMNQFLRASEFIDRLTIQPADIQFQSGKVVKKAEELVENLNDSKTANFEEVKSMIGTEEKTEEEY